MSLEATLVACLLVPLAAVPLIAATGARPNLREGVTISAGLILFGLVLSLWPEVSAGGRPGVVLIEPIPGLPLALEVRGKRAPAAVPSRDSKPTSYEASAVEAVFLEQRRPQIATKGVLSVHVLSTEYCPTIPPRTLA